MAQSEILESVEAIEKSQRYYYANTTPSREGHRFTLSVIGPEAYLTFDDGVSFSISAERLKSQIERESIRVVTDSNT